MGRAKNIQRLEPSKELAGQQMFYNVEWNEPDQNWVSGSAELSVSNTKDVLLFLQLTKNHIQ
jgi:hypothetical protein